MIALLTVVNNNIAGLFDGVTFDDPSGIDRALREYIAVFPDKRETTAQGEDFPYIYTHLSGFDITREGLRYTVSTEIGLFADTDTSQATLLSSVVVALKPLATLRFAPYPLIDDAVCTINDEKSPYYHVNIEMIFRDHN